MKMMKGLLTVALAAGFLTAGSAGADIYDMPSGLDSELPLFERPIVPGPGETGDHERISGANIEEGLWAAPFVWSADRAWPISGVSWWAGLSEGVGQGTGGDEFDPAGYLDEFTVRFYSGDTSPDQDWDDPLDSQTLSDFDWTPELGAEDNDFRYYHFGASRSSGLFDTWNPASAGVSPGDTLWLNVHLTQTGSDWQTGTALRWGRGIDPPTVGLAGAATEDYTWDSETNGGEWQGTGELAAFSIHVVPEPASMTLLGLGLAGFATRRFMSRKKKA